MIISLVSRKGGVGKTTSAIGFASAMAEQGRKTLLVDLDPQGSSSLSLGVRRSDFPPSAGDLVLGTAEAVSIIRPTTVQNLDLITASSDLADADRSLAGANRREQILRRKLDPIRDHYEFVFLDCPPSLTLLAAQALVASDGFVVPAVPQFLALEGVANLIAAAERINARNATRCRLLGVLLTMVDYRTRTTRANVEALRQRFAGGVFAIEIRVNTRLAEAPEFGQTIFQYDNDSTGANAYRLAAEELLLRVAGAEVTSVPPAVAEAAALAESPLTAEPAADEETPNLIDAFSLSDSTPN